MAEPSAPSPLQIPATWSAVAQGYAEEVVPYMALYVEEALRRVPLGPADRVLDIATGPGTLAFEAARRARSVEAIDFAPSMLGEVKARAQREGVTNIATTLMDAQALAFPNGDFDAVFCMFGFMFFPDRPRVFREVQRVLRRGGRALIATWATIDRRPLMQLGFEALVEALPDLPPPQKGDLQTSEDCIREMSEAGFRDVSAATFTASLHVDSAEQYFRVIERSGAPFVALKKRLGDEAWARAVERMLDALRRRIPAGGMDLSAEAILTSGAH